MTARPSSMTVAVFVLLVSAAAPADTLLPENYRAPRTVSGQPDLQGIWSYRTLTPMERPAELANKEFFSEQEAAEFVKRMKEQRNMDIRSEDPERDVLNAYNDFWWDWGDDIAITRRTSLVIDPPDGRIPPMTEEGKRRAAARAEYKKLHPADGPEDLSLADRCILFFIAGPPMTPGAYNSNFHLVQTDEYVLILNEMIHDARIVPLDGRPPLAPSVRQWLGSSRGRWEGETLVVETTNFTDKTNFRGTSEHMRLTERFTRIAEDVLLYEFTVDDPVTYTRAWTVQIPVRRTDGLMYEYACHEGNRSAAGILAGARKQEREASAQADRP